MAKLTIGVGVVLVLLGVVGYFGTGRQSWTALIPALFGIAFLVVGGIALNPDRRKHAMHAAAALGVLGLAGSIPGVIKAVRWLGGNEPARPAAVISQTIMALVTLAFIVMCVRSFIAARRARAFPAQPS
jgi:hypothetical protein